VMRNKYRWLNMFTSLIDTLGDGALGTFNIVFFFSMRMYTQGILYGIMKLLNSFRSTPLSFAAPYFIRKFSYRTLKIIKQILQVLRCLLNVGAVYFLRDRQELCGIAIFAIEFVLYSIITVCEVAEKDMDVRLGDYQMYLSGERLDNFAGVFGWFINPIKTLVALIIPLIVLKSGFNSNWDVLFIDQTRFTIIAVPFAMDLIGHIIMFFPYLFWDYDNEKHSYVMEVLKQREKLAYEGYYPAEYEGGLDFMEAGDIKNGIPVNFGEMLDMREAEKAAEGE
ncbi:MAG: hypothetical protein J5870_06055, partial [Clostridia bacterium]|nr:hypothetical protein [Clostridia bacterium]